MASSVIGDWVVKISVDGGGFTSGVSTVATSAATANETIAAQTSAIEANFDHITASATSAQSAVVAAAANVDLSPVADSAAAASDAVGPSMQATSAHVEESTNATSQSIDRLAHTISRIVLIMNIRRIAVALAGNTQFISNAMDYMRSAASRVGDAFRSMQGWIANAGRSAMASASSAFQSLGSSVAAVGPAAAQAILPMTGLATATMAALLPILAIVAAVAAVAAIVKLTGMAISTVTSSASTSGLTGEDKKRVERANKALADAKAAFGDLFLDVGAQMAVALAPAVEAVASFVYKIVRAAQPMAQVMQRAGVLIMEIAAWGYSLLFNFAMQFMPIIQAAFSVIAAVLDVIVTGVEAAMGAMEEMAGAISWPEDFQALIGTVAKYLYSFADSIRLLMPMVVTFFIDTARAIFSWSGTLIVATARAVRFASVMASIASVGQIGAVDTSGFEKMGLQMETLSRMDLEDDQARRRRRAIVGDSEKADQFAKEYDESTKKLHSQIALQDSLNSIRASGGENATPLSMRHYERRLEYENRLAELRAGGLDEDSRAYQELEAAYRTNELYQQRLDMMQTAAKITEEYRDPAEVFRGRIAELQQLVDAGQLDRGVAARAAGDALNRLERANGADRRVQLTSGLTSGSVEALSALNKARFAELQSGRRDPQERIEAALEANRVQQQRAADASVGILEFFRAAENN